MRNKYKGWDLLRNALCLVWETPFKVPLMRGIKIREFDKENLNVFGRVKRSFVSVVVKGA